MIALPEDHKLDIQAFSRTLSHTTNSYKFLWLLGLLDSLPNEASSPLIIPMRDIVEKMLITAEYPILQYRLSLGKADRLKNYIPNWVAARDDQSSMALSKNIDSISKQQKALERICRDLSRYVPQLWLVPFFDGKEDMPSRSDEASKKVREVSPKYFAGKSPLPYCFTEPRRGASIKIHPDWFEYFMHNRAIIRGWVMYHWINYLQARNPNTPGIVSKLVPPEQRPQMDKERQWWQTIVREMHDIRCIYSGEQLKAGQNFALDHFVPWSFVGHNRLWNLIPVSTTANSSKGDRLPDMKQYFGNFVKLQHQALLVCNELQRQPRGFGKDDLSEIYMNDLRIEVFPPPQSTQFKEAYSSVITPLVALAENQGFSPNWKWKRE